MERLFELLELDQSSEIKKSKDFKLDEEEEVEVLAFSIEEALQNAADAMSTSIVNLEYEILERGSNGFFGIGKKPYRILVKKSAARGDSFEGMDGLKIDFDAQNEIILNQDGNFKIMVRKSGAMLRVNPPKGDGKPVHPESIISSVERREIRNYDKNTITKAAQNASGKWVKIAEYIPSQLDSTFQIQVSPDEMKSFINITKPEKFGRVLEVDEIVSGLKSKHVLYGIKENIIRDSIENEIYNMPILVAEGDMPIEGKDAEIKYHFKTSTDEVKYDMTEDGRIDFHKLDIIQSVVVGQVLATKIPAENGKAGKTVTGRIIPARDGRDHKLFAGKNTHISPDGMQVIADINGQVVFKNGKINVEPILEINGDVDLTTGDINFPGNVVIFGSVNDTFKVYSGGNIEIKGNIGKAEVVAEGNIVVRQGIQGKDEARIICSGDLFARFVERSIVRVEGDVIIPEVLLHTRVDCKGRIICTGGKRSQIAGGVVRALYEINAKFLGAEAYTETIVEVGIDPEAEDKILELTHRKAEIEKELPDITKQLNNLSMMLAKGPLPPDKEEQFNILSLKNAELREEINSIEEQYSEIQHYLESLGKDAKISASKTTFPGVKIKIKNAILVVKSEYKYVTFYREEGIIKIVPYEKPKEIEEKIQNITKKRR